MLWYDIRIFSMTRRVVLTCSLALSQNKKIHLSLFTRGKERGWSRYFNVVIYGQPKNHRGKRESSTMNTRTDNGRVNCPRNPNWTWIHILKLWSHGHGQNIMQFMPQLQKLMPISIKTISLVTIRIMNLVNLEDVLFICVTFSYVLCVIIISTGPRNDALLPADNAPGESFRCSGLLLLELRMPCRHVRLNYFVWVKVQRIRLQASSSSSRYERRNLDELIWNDKPSVTIQTSALVELVVILAIRLNEQFDRDYTLSSNQTGFLILFSSV